MIRDPRIILGGGRGGFLDPRRSVIRGLPSAHCSPVWATLLLTLLVPTKGGSIGLTGNQRLLGVLATTL